MPRHAAFFVPRGQTLVVTFDNMKSREQPGPGYPFAFHPLAKVGHSHLGVVMSRRNDWFRHKAVDQFFDSLRARGFFDRFERIVFYGSSMGGYGALSFSAFCPGADVFAISPQSSLCPHHAPFEDRYKNGFSRGNWSGPFADGALAAHSARQVTVIYDPYEPLDQAHVDRLPQHNLTRLRTPFLGHVPARHLKHMGLMGTIARMGWDGTLTASAFREMRRQGRKSGKTAVRAILSEALNRGHVQLVDSALSAMQHSRPDWKFPKIRDAVDQSYGPLAIAAE